jgi:integrase/recombinase XerC
MPETPHFTETAAFTAYLRFEKRYSAHTVRAYADDLSQFAVYLSEAYGFTDVKQIKSTQVRSWLAEMKEGGMVSRSINRKISTLKSFFKFLIRNGVITRSPMLHVVAPKVSKRLPVYVAEAQMNSLFTDIEFAEGAKGQTERLIILLLYHTGMRLSELLAIKIYHIDFQRKSLKVLGKGNKERVLPLTDPLEKALKEYVTVREKQEHAPESSDFLFLTDKGKKLYPRAVYRVVKKYLTLVSTIEKKSPHVLRHSFATHLSNNGAPLNPVKELLGHASLAATQIYTHNTIEKLKDIHKKTHPKA